jgi:hypothetical protein
MRSSRRTTPHIAENSIVNDATDACSLRRMFATFLADSYASLGCPYFYLIQSYGWKSLCLLTGLSVQDYSKLLLQSKLVLVRNNNDGSRLIKVDKDQWNLFLGRRIDHTTTNQKSASDGAITTRATTPAVLLGREGGGGRRSADVVLPGQEGSGVRL